MDIIKYKYAGKSSRNRFEKELYSIAKVFDAVILEPFNDINNKENDYWYDSLINGKYKQFKFKFPNKTDKTLVKWFNNIYSTFDKNEVKIIWMHISSYNKIKNISAQIWFELETLVECDEGWNIIK